MTQLVCPLCGRFISVERFDPSHFEDDVYAVEVTGLGRGRGFMVTDRFSVLDDPSIMGLVADRCRRILGLVEGGMKDQNKEVEGLRETLNFWVNRATLLQNQLSDAGKTMTVRDEKIQLLTRENNSFKQTVDELKDRIRCLENPSDSECLLEMEELLERINDSANSDFETLSDAVDFLLEV